MFGGFQMQATIQGVPEALRVGGADFVSNRNSFSCQNSYPKISRIENMPGICYAIVVH
jgi:hypothetical protein